MQIRSMVSRLAVTLIVCGILGLTLSCSSRSRLPEKGTKEYCEIVSTFYVGVAYWREGHAKDEQGRAPFQMVKTGSSYLSQRELPLTFGLGKPEGKNVSLEIVWPSGRKDSVSDIKPNDFVTVQEGTGIVSIRPIVFANPAP
jgi:hypothetical protein